MEISCTHMGTTEDAPTGVRFDAAIKRRLKEIARDERRTFGAQVNLACEEWLRQRDSASPSSRAPRTRIPQPTEPTRGSRASESVSRGPGDCSG